jgi:hypothetical protein
MIPRVPLREALSDPNLLGTAIAGDSWSSWRTLLIAAMGEPLREDEREVFSQLTRRACVAELRANKSGSELRPTACWGREIAVFGK